MALGISELARFEALERRVAEQQRSIEAQQRQIEALLRSRTPAALARCNAARKAESRRLDDAIAAALTDQQGPGKLTAKHIVRFLERHGFEPLPSERTVRLHVAALRGGMATHT